MTPKYRGRLLLLRLVDLLVKLAAFQLMYYFYFCAAGIYGVFIAGGRAPLTLQNNMTHTSILLFYWLNIVGPVLGTAGLILEHRQYRRSGCLIQLGGNTMFAAALLGYIVATFSVETWGRGMYGAFPLGIASLTSTLCLVLRDGLRVKLKLVSDP